MGGAGSGNGLTQYSQCNSSQVNGYNHKSNNTSNNFYMKRLPSKLERRQKIGIETQVRLGINIVGLSVRLPFLVWRCWPSRIIICLVLQLVIHIQKIVVVGWHNWLLTPMGHSLCGCFISYDCSGRYDIYGLRTFRPRSIAGKFNLFISVIIFNVMLHVPLTGRGP